MAQHKDQRVKTGKITYNIKKNQYIICKDSVYYSLTIKQVNELKEVLDEIINLYNSNTK